MRVEVELRQVGQALQHNEQAADPQQQARLAAHDPKEQTPNTAPIDKYSLQFNELFWRTSFSPKVLYSTR